MKIATDDAYQGASIFIMNVFGKETISFSFALTDSVYRP